MSFKVGDFVYYNMYDNHKENRSGLIVNISENNIFILSSNKDIEIMEKEKVKPLSDRDIIVKEINDYYDDKIQEYRNKLKSEKRSDYVDEINSKYYLLKQEILNTAKNMIELDLEKDAEFENKLKAICEKKKNMFSIKCDGMNDARKFNGEVRYNMDCLERSRQNNIRRLDEGINKLKGVFNNTKQIN